MATIDVKILSCNQGLFSSNKSNQKCLSVITKLKHNDL